jgi:phage baseplate assembly protein W
MGRFRRKTLISNVEPNSTVGALPIGITLPFNNQHGIFNQSFTNRDQVLSNVKNLLLTAKGERYMLPEFGTEIQFVLFENITSEDEFSERIRSEISDAISTWLPYLTIQKLTVDINMSEDGRISDPTHAVGIRLDLLISGTNIYLPIQIFISDTGALTIQEAIYNG